MKKWTCGDDCVDFNRYSNPAPPAVPPPSRLHPAPTPSDEDASDGGGGTVVVTSTVTR